MEQATQAGQTFTELITPYLPVIGVIFGGLIVGGFGLWNRKRGAVETRAPDVNELWQQQDSQNKALDFERKLRRFLEDSVRELLSVFKDYVDRVRKGGSTELNTKELKIYESTYSDLVREKEE